MKQFLECGKIVNTHGLRGELKVEPWCDSPEFLCQLRRVFIGEREIAVTSARVQGHMVILALKGVEDVNAAIALKGKVLLFDRSDVLLEPGTFYVQDALGLPVFTEDGTQIGVLQDVLERPAADVYVVSGSDREYLIPNVPEFVKEVNIAEARITVALIEGM